jgi:hypothetical protein
MQENVERLLEVSQAHLSNSQRAALVLKFDLIFQGLTSFRDSKSELK